MIALENEIFQLPPKPDFPDLQRALFCHVLLNRLASNEYPLDYLNLSYQKLEDNQMLFLTKALEKNTAIKTLILSGNNLSHTPALCDFIGTNQTITTLYLDHNNIGGSCAQKLAESLKGNTTLKELFLGHNAIGDSGAAAFGETLALNHQLKTLDLSHNFLHDISFKVLASNLRNNHGLTKLILKDNFFGSEGAKAFADCFKENDTLESLDLENCCTFDFMALKLILEGLAEKKNRTLLKELKIDRNNMGDVEAIALAKALQANYGLKSLKMAKNYLEYRDMDGEGFIAIIESVIKHPSLTRIDLRENYIRQRASEIVRIVEENTHIISLQVEEKKNTEISKVLPKINELLEKNREKLLMMGKWLLDHFTVNVEGEIDREILKYYQACDHDLLIEQIGKEQYEKIKKGVDRYLAVNYLKLMGCMGNGKSTIEQLSPQMHVNIFSYLDLSKCFWLEEIYRTLEDNKTAFKNVQVPNKSHESEGSKCNMW